MLADGLLRMCVSGQGTASGPQDIGTLEKDPLCLGGSNNGQCAGRLAMNAAWRDKGGRELPCRCRLGAG